MLSIMFLKIIKKNKGIAQENVNNDYLSVLWDWVFFSLIFPILLNFSTMSMDHSKNEK